MKLSDTTVRWYDVVFIVVFPMAFNLLFGLSGVDGSSLGWVDQVKDLFRKESIDMFGRGCMIKVGDS